MDELNKSSGAGVAEGRATDGSALAVLELERERYRAMLAGDVEKLNELFSTHLVYTHASTRRDTKSSYLERIQSGFYKYLRLTPSDLQVVIIGSTALITGQLVSEVVVDKVHRTLDSAFLGVWVREDLDWRFVAHQPTPLPLTARATI